MEGKSVCLVITRGQIQYLLALATPEQMWSLERAHDNKAGKPSRYLRAKPHRHQGHDSSSCGQEPWSFQGYLWWHWWDRAHFNTVTAEVFRSGKVSSRQNKYLVDPVSLAGTPLFQVFTVKYLSPNVTEERWTDRCLMHRRFGLCKRSTRSSLLSPLFFDWLNDAINGGLW